MNWVYSKTLLRIVAILVILPGMACKKSRSSGATTHNALASNPSVAADQYMSALESEQLNFSTEYQNYLNAITVYQASSIYQNPQNDNQKLLNVLAGMLSGLSDPTTKQDLQQDILDKNFAQFAGSFANMNNYQGEIQSFIGETESIVGQYNNVSTPPPISDSGTNTVTTVVNTVTVKSVETVTVSETSTGIATATNAPNKTLLIVSGVFLFVLTGAVLTHTIFRAKKVFTTMKLEDYRDNFAKNFFFDHALVLKSVLLLYFSVMILKGLEQNGTVAPQYLRDPALVIGLVAGLAAVYWTFEAGMNLYYMHLAAIPNTPKTSDKYTKAQAILNGVFGGEYKSNKYYKLDLKESIFGGKTSNTWSVAEPYKNQKLPESVKNAGGNTKFEFTKSIGGALVASLFAAGGAYIYAELGLAGQAPDMLFLSQTMRFFGVCEVLSEAGTLTLN